MSKSSAISARIDETLKQDAENVFNALGLTASQAITLFYRQVALHRGIPFDVRLPTVAGPKTEPSISSHQAGFYESPERMQLLQEQQAYEAMHEELWANYPNQFVAITDGKLVDRDEDEVALFERREQNFPNQVVLIKQITETPVTTLHVRSPRIIRT
ncbi:MAG TPA: type II toxin-antitoxin system RelB/DinJ family antitoxin [Caldilineaceae bacterium]|nr:type II toxin-antitoxin system RelB/DinJ family antitoxin [Caldilineaceae bacterium]